MYLVNESSKREPVKRVYKTREKSQSLLDHPRTAKITLVLVIAYLLLGSTDEAFTLNILESPQL